ncbi:MAG: SDR family oxidoreductase [Bacteroidia bacterium]
MNLKSKRILVFGGEASFIESILPILKSQGAQLYWCINSDKIDTNWQYQGLQYIPLESIEHPESYQKELLPQLKLVEHFDGLVFALSEGTLRPMNMTKPSIVNRLMTINSNAFIEIVRILVKGKLISAGASIVAISSISSLKGLKSKMAYAASKAALNSVVLNMASELANKKIRVNAVLKGALSSDFEHFHVKNMAAIGTDDSTNTELGLTEPYELAELCSFLLSDSVKTMTGSLIKLDGGYSL